MFNVVKMDRSGCAAKARSLDQQAWCAGALRNFCKAATSAADSIDGGVEGEGAGRRLSGSGGGGGERERQRATDKAEARRMEQRLRFGRQSTAVDQPNVSYFGFFCV